MASQDTLRQPVLAGRWEYDPRVVFAAGNNAQTFAGRDLRSDEEVVVKIFSHADGGRGRERFLREARLHEELEHEAILELLGQGRDGGVDYIVTRRLRPGALGDVVRQQSGLSPAVTLTIGLRIADALAYMHGRNEVHGDISPGNILLDGEGGAAAYLADFGFSKRVATAPIATTGDGFGTPGFSLPRRPGENRTHEDDVYGLAAVLWFCLTGEPPAESSRIRRHEISSRALRAPLNEALAWESGAIPTALEFRASLSKHWAKSARDWRAVSAPPRRSRLPLAGVAALIGLAIAGLSGRTLQPEPAPAAGTTIGVGREVTLHLDGRWTPMKAPHLPVFRLRDPVAATNDRAVVVVGRAPSAGQRLISRQARSSLPAAARTPEPVVVAGRAALRYDSAAKVGLTEEVLALPLARDALVVRCNGPASDLSRTCAQTVADLELRDGAPQALAPTAGTARWLRDAVSRLADERRHQRSLLAAAGSESEAAPIAERLAAADRAFARRLTALSTTAQDAPSVERAAAAARRAADAYSQLARAGTAAAWGAGQVQVDRRERQLADAVRGLGRLRTYEH